MIRLMWNLGVSVHALLQFAPTNVLLRAIRAPLGLKWGVPAMLLSPVYLFAAGICFTLVERGWPGWIAMIGLLMFWNCCKFFWIGPVSLVALLRRAIRQRRQRHAQARSAGAVPELVHQA